MDSSNLFQLNVLRFILLVTPGLISTLLYFKLTRRTNMHYNIKVFMYVIIFTTITFSLSIFTDTIFNNIFKIDIVKTLKSLFSDKQVIEVSDFKSFINLSILGVFVTMVFSFIHVKNIIFKYAKKLHLTTYLFGESFWENFMSKEEYNTYLEIRVNNMTYLGYIDDYSIDEYSYHIVIKDVVLPDQNDKYLEFIYLQMDLNSFSINKINREDLKRYHQKVKEYVPDHPYCIC